MASSANGCTAALKYIGGLCGTVLPHSVQQKERPFKLAVLFVPLKGQHSCVVDRHSGL